VDWISGLLKCSTGDALKFLHDEDLEIKDRFPGEFEMMANAHALQESCQPIVEEMISKGGAKAIAVCSSYGDGTDRVFLDSPRAEWLWEYAEANDLVVHVHPPMVALGHESLMQYRLNEALGRPFDSTVTAARMIGSGVFDRHPKLQVLIVHLGGGLTSTIGRLDFNWHLNYNGIANPPDPVASGNSACDGVGRVSMPASISVMASIATQLKLARGGRSRSGECRRCRG
jgi:hypothetical protein